MVDQTEQKITTMNKSLQAIAKTLNEQAGAVKKTLRLDQDASEETKEGKQRAIETDREKTRRDEAVLDALQDIAGGLKPSGSPTEKPDGFGLKELLLGLTAGLAAAFAPFAKIAEKITGFFKAFGKNLKAFRTSVTGFFARITNLFKKFKLPKIGEGVRILFSRIANLFKNLKFPKFLAINSLFDRIASFFKKFKLPRIPEMFNSIKNFFGRIVNVFKNFKLPRFTFPAGLKTFLAALSPSGLFTKVGQLISGIAKAPLKGLKFITEGFKGLSAFIKSMPIIGKIIPFLGKIARLVFLPLTAIFTVASGLIGAFDAIKAGEDLLGVITGFFSSIIDFLSFGLFPADEVKDLMTSSFNQLLAGIKGIIKDGLDFGDLKLIFGGLKTAVFGILELIKNALLKVIGGIGGLLGFDEFEKKLDKIAETFDIEKEVTSLLNRIGNFFTSVFDDFMQFIDNFSITKIVSGMKQSVAAKLGFLAKYVPGLEETQIQTSPSSQAAVLARNSSEGLSLLSPGQSIVNSLTGPTVNSVTNTTNLVSPQPKDRSFVESATDFILGR